MALPLILAGPIVRRVEPRLAVLWLATSRSCDVTATIWPDLQTIGAQPGTIDGPANPWASSDPTPTRPIGGKLHVVVVVVEVPPEHAPLLPGSVYSYNIKLESPPLLVTDLGRERLLVDETVTDRIPDVDPAAPLNLALGYESDRLPSFVTCPATLDDLFIIQSGCRNTNSKSFDTTAWIDDLIADAIHDPLVTQRPHQLYLTGDQIYADDVSMAMLPPINRLGIELLEFREELPLVAGTHEATLRNFPALRRAGPCKTLAHFSAGSSNHLLSFSEFCAMYLHAWSPAVWRPLADPDSDIFVDNDQSIAEELRNLITPYKTAESKREKVDPDELVTNKDQWKALNLKTFEARVARAEIYRAAVPRMRRALANCATYMIFDDHEVTDDWNISKEWSRRVVSSPFGRTVVRNALSAYTIFQGWGNDPKKFEAGPNKDMLDQVTALIGADGGPVIAAADAIDKHLGMSGTPPDVDWHYTIDGPLHRTVVIDTRTRRSYAGLNSPPKLLGSSLNAMVPEGPLTDGREVLILVAPQPPLMPALFDQVAQPIGANVLNFKAEVESVFESGPQPIQRIEKGSQRLEGESWGLEEFGLEELLGRLAPYKRVLILSGDVHFSAGLTMDYWRKGQSSADRFVQLILSPSKNEWGDSIVNFVRGTALSQRFAEIGMPAERLAWKKAEDVLVPPSLNEVPPGLLARMRHSPALLPAKGWPIGTDFKQKDDKDVVPDWRWRMDLLVDQRPDGDRPVGVQPPPPGPDIDPSNPGTLMSNYFQAAARHQQMVADHKSHLRRLVFPAGIGLVTFPEIGGTRHVRHVVLSRTLGNPDAFDENTVHEAPLEPTTDPQPEIQFNPNIGTSTHV
jgi:hypothetical protein